MQMFKIYCITSALLALLIKLIFWYKIPNRKIKTFWHSMFFMFDKYDMYNIDNPKIASFWKVSNVCNVFFWIALIGNVFIFSGQLINSLID